MGPKLVVLAIMLLTFGYRAMAEVSTVVIGYQYGLTYLPLMVMQEQKLLEKMAKIHGLNELTPEWRVLSGPAPINDGLLSGNIHFGAVGTPSLVTLWAKTKSNLGVRAVGSLAYLPMYLNTNNPKVQSIKDFSSQDKIAVPSVKVGVQAVTLQMAAAQAFGEKNYSKLDPLTVGMGHPEAYIALMSGKSEVTAHFASAPFQTQELEDSHGKIRTILKSYDILGGKATFTAVVATNKFRLANPKVYDIFVAAFAEATAFINQDKKAAAELYLRFSKTKESSAVILAILNDPDTEFDLTPRQIAKYAQFMHQVGTIKEAPTSWQDLVFPNLMSRPGS